ncbi:alpha-ketoglutarate-dependent dioxygenase AlkB [Anthocerotibacter panamensis]|uniref:alpha-ketoglutarate-dependent dioxygenase AlkB n=1 Tax=Anthocerotibacter panamensis TaxID=2857077 RepID=UPI001C402A38|nr:alpha-ketoglutarate-dependent dioxygenase AlkB [Anthocerotibacter panamensis]
MKTAFGSPGQLELDFTKESVETEIPGLTYIRNYINPSRHDTILEEIYKGKWLNDLKRRVQHYGYKYDYKSRSIDRSMYLGNLPPWAHTLALELYQYGYTSEIFDQAIVNEYEPGQGISRHIDCPSCFKNVIVSISLGSSCVMNLEHRRTGSKTSILLEPRTLLVMQNEARYEWLHSIPARKMDTFDGYEILRKTRVSLTFRKVILH